MRFILLFLMIFLSQQCMSQSVTREAAPPTLPGEFARNYYIQNFGFTLPETWNKTLYDTVESWLGIPYCHAGMSQKGFDCSGLVTALYQDVYKSVLGARNSADIYKKITKVDKDELVEGDLVFFRIRSRRITHVGLYLGNHKFVHASSSNGVMISDLNEPYYKKYYAGGGHIIAAESNNN